MNLAAIFEEALVGGMDSPVSKRAKTIERERRLMVGYPVDVPTKLKWNGIPLEHFSTPLAQACQVQNCTVGLFADGSIRVLSFYEQAKLMNMYSNKFKLVPDAPVLEIPNDEIVAGVAASAAGLVVVTREFPQSHKEIASFSSFF